ncbi:MAG: Gfo/Idh/MocA family protein [Candidatus Thorarchaeota archaeon]
MGGEAGLRLGLIGIGKTGRTHLAALNSLRAAGLLNIEINAVSDIDKNKLKKAAKEFNVPAVYDDYVALINDDNVDVVYVCTPTSKHTDMVKEAARANKAVYCDKPLAHSCPQVRELNAVAIDSSIPTSAGLMLRYDPFLLYAKRLVENHDFGKPLLAHIHDDQQFPLDQEDYAQWRGDSAVPGGGILLHQSIQDIDVLIWFFGDIVNVYAQVGFYGDRGIEDQASLIMQHKNGATSTIDSLWHGLDRPNERKIEFFFEKGFIGIILESGNTHLDYHLQGADQVRVHSENAEEALLEHLNISSNNLALSVREPLSNALINKHLALSYSFLKAVLYGETPSPNFLDAASAHKIVDAAYESANKKVPIDIL